MIFIRSFLFLIILFSAVPSFAAERAAPFGFEIGEDTLISSRTKAIEKGYWHQINNQNKYSGGLMLDVDVSSAQVNGVKTIILIFDRHETLQGVTFKTHKQHFFDFNGYMSQKYAPVKYRTPLVGNNHAEYHAPNAIIELNAPYEGFKMNILYASQELLSAFQHISKAEDKKQKKNEASQF